MDRKSEKNVKENIIYNLIKTLMGILFPFISFPYAARVLGVNNLGMVQYSASIITYFALFAELGINVYATREGAKFRNNKEELSTFAKEILTINVATSGISYLILFFCLFIGIWSEYKELLLICSLSILFTTFKMEWLYQIMEEFKYTSIRSFVFQILSLCLLFVFVRSSSDYVEYAFITIFASGGSFALNIWKSKKYIKWNIKIDKENLRGHVKPVLVIFGITAAAQIYLNLDTIMIGVIRGTAEVGLYSASVKLVNAIKTMFSSVSIVLLARLSTYINDNSKDSFTILFEKAFNIVMIFIIPLIFGIIVFRDEVIIYLYGNEYVPTSFSLIILSMNMFFSVVDGMLYQQVCLPFYKEKNACVATIIGACINFLLNIFFINNYGFNGAAITTLISEIIVFIILYIQLKNTVSFTNLFCNVPQYLSSSLIMFGVLTSIRRFVVVDIQCMVILTGLGAVCYAMVLLLLRNQYLIYLIRMINFRKSS